MKLRFGSAHLSITSFPEVELPSLSVITGRNGSGKTHLLRAIEAHKIYVEADGVGQLAQTDIRFHDWNSLTPNDPGAAVPDQIQAEKKSVFDQLNTCRSQRNFDERIRSIVRQTEAPSRYLENPSSFLRLKSSKIEEYCTDNLFSETIDPQIRALLAEFENTLAGQYGPMCLVHSRAVSEIFGHPVIALNESEITSPRAPFWGQSDIFQQQFGRIFVQYRDTKLYNEMAAWRKETGRSTEHCLTEEEFRETYGEPPWEFVNRVIRRAGLDFYVSHPLDDRPGPFHPTLHKRASDAQINYGELSSGEKILMSLAICVYHASDSKILPVLPKLMLFDEIDATLHPSMSRSLLETIAETLVDRLSVGVIMTTHSASTVALAPEGSVFVMLSGSEGLANTTKAKALNILTEGVPTLAVSFDGRRQVLVESPSDAEILGSLFKQLRSQLESERSLEFVATGKKSRNGTDVNTGKEVVIGLVNSLAQSGNSSVFGLIDFDGKNLPDERVFVLGGGDRDGLENYVFDPLIMVGTLVRQNGGKLNPIGLDESLPYADFLNKPIEEMQRYVNAMAAHLFEVDPSTSCTKSEVTYLDGSKLEIDTRFMSLDDHDLHELYVKKLPILNNIPREGDGGLRLLKYVVDNVLADRSELIPQSVKATFEAILATELE
jgi:ABC-type branched-subunit amino acid transport system ATPase component